MSLGSTTESLTELESNQIKSCKDLLRRSFCCGNARGQNQAQAKLVQRMFPRSLGTMLISVYQHKLKGNIGRSLKLEA